MSESCIYSDTCLIILSASECGEDVVLALKKSADALGYEQAPLFLNACELENIREAIFDIDPWAVIAIDDKSIQMLGEAFALNSDEFHADCPVLACGYKLVAVPDFASCLNNQEKKRIAWTRLKTAQHPGPVW